MSAYGASRDVRAITGSTSDDARIAAEAGAPSGHVVVADAQTAGRGSRGRAWSSPPGDDLYFSIVERAELKDERRACVTLAVGLGVAEAIERETGVGARVKWPNDVWLGAGEADARKCAGILVESSSVGARLGPLIIGVGGGVNRMEWGELAGAATSMRGAMAPGAPRLDRERVLDALLARIEARVRELERSGPEPIVTALHARLLWRGARVRIDEREGVLEGIAKDGALLVGGARFLAGDLRLA